MRLFFLQVLKCLVCHKTTAFLMKKRQMEEPASLPEKKKSKKKKKKDPLSGLSPAILDVIKAPSSSKSVSLPKISKAEVVCIESLKCTCGSRKDDEDADADEGAAFPDRFGHMVCKLHNRIPKTG